MRTPRRYRIVPQARISSSRLRGKVLLPVCGLPIVVLAAQRAARDGIETVIATSVDPTDDPLVETLHKHGVRYMRGALDDVLARYVAAVADLDDDDLCVRLTCDNVFPDSDFIRRLIAAAESNPTGYAGTQGGTDGLPFGLAAEAVPVRLLRQAARETQDPYDHEHVTPWIIRRCGRNAPVILPPKGVDLTGVRCTVDTIEDYRHVASGLAGLPDPVSAPWQEMCRRFAQWHARAQPFVPARIVAGELQASLVLGGAPFGVANGTARLDDRELRAILDLAEAAGVSHLETAAGYGDSESRIGSALTPESPLAIVTRLPDHLLEGAPPVRDVAQRVHVAVDRSLWHLRRQRLDAVLLDRFEHYAGAGGTAWQTLLSLQAEGKIGRIGVSVERPDKLIILLQNREVGLVQVPFDMLDRRWLEPALQRAIAARPDVVLHGRWSSSSAPALERLASRLGRESVADLGFAHARAQTWLAGIVAGAHTADEMAELIRLFRKPPLTPDEVATVVSISPALDPAL
jgi:spore coat polysaccharide biosynthesis protein SpsF